ncbi:MAG: threonine--tRNA ligase [Candidatus Moranbacteria bacterium CG23_combo_of_CG06-09_8_20_14_all_39_10]|nr:MAG: threonine--tRNA ligase [Candidatus Moranbacteria bacterium CG23_combo_of_CG06-09_8_20_14_all_39_10]
MKKNRVDKESISGVQHNVSKNNSLKSTLKAKKGGKAMSIKQKEESKSEWLIALPDGSIEKAGEFKWSGSEDLKVFYSYESSGSREVKEAPAHVKMMQQMELADYEPAADSGNFRWMPKGHLIKRLMERHASDIVRNYGGMQVETPIMYDLNHPQLASYLKRFPARQYHLLSGDKKFFLRFAACFGQYLIMHDMGISYSHLPVRIYELTHYSFRREQAGELAGLRRLRVFTMPDMHSLCVDVEQAKEEFYQQYLLCKKWMSDLELNHVMAIRVVDDFFQKNRDFIMGIVKDFGRPVLLEVWKERFFYFVLKFEFNVIDGQKKAAALSTVQIDVENAERFDINYVDKDGKQQRPLLLHASISGSIDRNLYALLELQARKMQKGDVAKLPYWLCPVQVRLIPVADRHLARCQEIASKMGARVEIDDRKETVGRKIREAEVNWVPFVGMVGDKELESQTIAVRERGVSGQKEMKESEFSQSIDQLQGDKPFESLGWPSLLSKQPRFR